MQSRFPLQLSQQIVRLGPKLEDSSDLAALHLLDRKAMIDVDRLNLDAQTLEDRGPRDARTRSLHVKSHLLACQILQAVNV